MAIDPLFTTGTYHVFKQVSVVKVIYFNLRTLRVPFYGSTVLIPSIDLYFFFSVFNCPGNHILP